MGDGYAAAPMGQPIAVNEKPGAHGGMVRFDLNRSLTGMGHEHYTADRPVTGDRPPDELARRLFATGRAAAVHCYMNMVTVELEAGATSEGMVDIIENLYRFYPDSEEPAAAHS